VFPNEQYLAMTEIKKSLSQQREKDVLLLTPVMVCSEDLMKLHAPRKYVYQHGERFNQLPPLPA
jgi:hypothetical protein